MFSLIITIVSIALVAALALATIYYGGDAFTQGGDAARASQAVNEGQQLQGALTLRSVQEPTAAALTSDMAALVTGGYVSQVPTGWTADTANSVFTKTVSAAVCAAVNDASRANIADADAVAAGYQAPVALPATNVYGCVDGNVVQFRF